MSIGVIDMEGLRLGIDLGGTTVKVGFVGEGLEIVDKVIYRSRPLDEMSRCAEFSDQLRTFVVEARYDPAAIEGIGVAIPGTVLGAEIELLPNMQLDLQLLLESLRDYFPNADLAYLNDANAGALAEAAFGAGVGYRNVLYVTIGTGIGAGVVIGGKVIAGAHGAAGEIGHVSVAKGGRRCSCGRRGCLEQYASATGIVRVANDILEESKEDSKMRHVEKLSAKNVLDFYKEGDALAVKTMEKVGDILGSTLAVFACVTDPEAIVIGGGVSKAGKPLTDCIQKYYQKYAFPSCKSTPIILASLGNDAGIYGAARMVIKD